MILYFWLLSFGSFILMTSAEKFPIHRYTWTNIDYKWDNHTKKDAFYDPKRQVIIDAEGSKDGRIFFAVLRTKGVPASLTVMNKINNEENPILEPYPDWSWARKDDCNSIISVFRTAIDKCNRLWVLDTGMVDNKQICPNKLLAFNLFSDKLVNNFTIPNYIIHSNKSSYLKPLTTPIVETEGEHCERTYVHMADVMGNNLAVYNGSTIWRVNPEYYVDYWNLQSTNPLQGIVGLALSPIRDFDRFLFYRPRHTHKMVKANAWYLRKFNNHFSKIYEEYSSFLLSQVSAMTVTSEGILFFGFSNALSIGCWNMDTPLNDKNIELLDLDIGFDSFVGGLKVIPNHITGSGEQLWITTYTRLGRAAVIGSMKNELFITKIDELINGTKCDPRPKIEPKTENLLERTYNYLEEKNIFP